MRNLVTVVLHPELAGDRPVLVRHGGHDPAPHAPQGHRQVQPDRQRGGRTGKKKVIIVTAGERYYRIINPFHPTGPFLAPKLTILMN